MTPKPDDFRLERDGDAVIATFAPTGARYTAAGGQSAAQVEAPRDGRGDYVEDEVRAMAGKLIALAAQPTPSN
ncbi:hypothetical protein SLNSH_21265 [Alsobacter soli]|uniref:Uncharacterized protein n=1 Tax=Alsobacter soli TaxID=2109933 RepID=A0A2T1HMS1_9HYPH|nr:hypothetical protein [Alsobacter soli]PSC02923.1 hypothetical protein SLNSH_21265 [Alsobacter soli]